MKALKSKRQVEYAVEPTPFGNLWCVTVYEVVEGKRCGGHHVHNLVGQKEDVERTWARLQALTSAAPER